jgi:mono/diheme cytochrome c family protein
MTIKNTKRLLGMSALMLGMSSFSHAAEYAANGSYTTAKVPDSLEQGLSHNLLLEWWFTSQGSRIIPYNWFLALEQADSEELVRSNENLENRLRFIAWPAHPKWNPDGLPIGFTKDNDAKTGKAYMGVNCAACHTSKIEFNGKAVLTEGGPAHADFDRFITEIGDSLQAVLDNDQKFARFANRVLNGKADAASIAALRIEVKHVTEPLAERIKVNHPPHPNGYGRLDAYGNIFNAGSVFAINEPSNAKPSNAPVSFPVVWDAAQHDILQWNGSAVNAGLGPYTRNTGEVVGVFGDMRIQKTMVFGSPKLRYEHHINVKALERLEELLTHIESPVWPEKMLPAIDKKKAELGKQHYEKNCVSCHQPIDRADPNRHIAAQMIPVTEVGTDPTMAINAATSVSKTGILEGQPMLPLTKFLPSMGVIEVFGSTAPTAKVVGNGIVGALRDELGLIKVTSLLSDYITAAKKNALIANCDPKEQGAKCYKPPRYKARPLNGIWASAPFLHNGSIPNLTELLKTPDQRVAKFNVGSWEFDPVNVGFSTTEAASTSEFNTSLSNDSNRGHNYGTGLSDSEKAELIEYLKSL